MPVPFYIVLGFAVQVTLGVLALKKRRNNEKLFITYILVATLTDLAGTGIALSGNANLWLYNIYTPIELLLLGFLVINAVREMETFLKNLVIIAAGLTTYLMFTDLANIATMLVSALLFTLALLLFILKVREMIRGELKNMDKRYLWISAGMIIYFGTNTIGFVLMYGEIHNLVHSTTNIIQNLAYIGALYDYD